MHVVGSDTRADTLTGGRGRISLDDVDTGGQTPFVLLICGFSVRFRGGSPLFVHGRQSRLSSWRTTPLLESSVTQQVRRRSCTRPGSSAPIFALRPSQVRAMKGGANHGKTAWPSAIFSLIRAMNRSEVPASYPPARKASRHCSGRSCASRSHIHRTSAGAM